MGFFFFLLLFSLLFRDEEFLADCATTKLGKRLRLGELLRLILKEEYNPNREQEEQQEPTQEQKEQKEQKEPTDKLDKLGKYGTPTQEFTTIKLREEVDNRSTFAWEIEEGNE